MSKPTIDADLRRRLNEALAWNANLVRLIEPIVAEAVAEAKKRRPACGCGWCCARTPHAQRGEMHRRTCRP